MITNEFIFNATIAEKKVALREKIERRQVLKNIIAKTWISEASRIEKYKEIKELARDIKLLYDLVDAEERTLKGALENLGAAAREVGREFLKALGIK